MLCFDSQNKNKFGLESWHLVTPNNSCIWLQKLACLLGCIAYSLVTYLPSHSPLLRVLQSSLNKIHTLSSTLHFVSVLLAKNKTTQKGKRLGPNHFAGQKKRVTSHLSESSASTLRQYYCQPTNRHLRCFSATNTSPPPASLLQGLQKPQFANTEVWVTKGIPRTNSSSSLLCSPAQPQVHSLDVFSDLTRGVCKQMFFLKRTLRIPAFKRKMRFPCSQNQIFW